jgi:hypothetical protein
LGCGKTGESATGSAYFHRHGLFMPDHTIGHGRVRAYMLLDPSMM